MQLVLTATTLTHSLQVSHDPDAKIDLGKKKFKNVRISTCLCKEYPTKGPYAGGIVFRRYFGMGEGIGFTKSECEALWDDVKLEDHVQYVHVDKSSSSSSSVAPTAAATPPGAAQTAPTVAATPPTKPGAAQTAPTAAATPPTKPGTCHEVFWEDDDAWFACIVTDEAEGEDGNVVSSCAYDDGVKMWHDLQNELHRPIAPNAERLAKMTCGGLRSVLRGKGVSVTGRKAELIAKCLQAMTTATTTAAAATTAVTEKATAATAAATTAAAAAETEKTTATTTAAAATTAVTEKATAATAAATTAATEKATAATAVVAVAAATGEATGAASTTAPAAPPAAAAAVVTTTAAPAHPPARAQPGTCHEVFWDEDEEWYACVIVKEKVQQNGATVSLCAYDDGIKLYHDLQNEQHRPIASTAERLGKVPCGGLRSLLRDKGVSVAGRKAQLIAKCMQLHTRVHADTSTPPPNPDTGTPLSNTDTGTPAATTDAGTSTATTALSSETPVDVNVTASTSSTATTPAMSVTTDITTVNSILTPKCTFRQTHAERVAERRKSRSVAPNLKP